MRKCTFCHVEKPVDKFNAYSKIDRRPRSVCKQCALEQSHRRTPGRLGRPKKVPEDEKLYKKGVRQMFKRYGITPADFRLYLAAQKNRCAICKSILELKTRTIDHDHSTGKVRGLLCRHCNTGLGCFRDDQSSLRRAIKYLAKNQTTQETHSPQLQLVEGEL